MFLDPATPQRWPVSQTPYEAESLRFCRAWLSGQSEFVLQTSGSTGTPKPIALTRAQLRASAHLTGQTLGLQPGDAALACLNIRYVAGVMMLVRGLELGLPMTIIEPVSNPLADFEPGRAHFAFAAFVPLQLQTILEQAANKLSILNKMKAILVGGAATSPALERALQVIESPVFATYGMTETVSHVALRRLNGAERSDWFTALDGVDLGTDGRGCLHITSAATNFVRVQTSDVVELIDTGHQGPPTVGPPAVGPPTVGPPAAGPPTVGPAHFRLLGRADNVINSGGVKVQPEPVERVIGDVLATAGGLGRLFVAGLPDERLGQRVALFCEAWNMNTEQWNQVQDAVRQQIGPYAVPKEAITVNHFLETPTGKIDRARTIDRYR